LARIRDITAFLAQTGDDAPTPAERRLVADCQAGEECWLGDGERPTKADPDRTIRAELLRALILGSDKGCEVDTIGVMLWGAWITSPLDLSFARAKGQTLLVNCHFTDPVTALQTRFDLLNLEGSKLTSLMAQGAKVNGDVFLRNGFHATGEVSLSGASIGGQLVCSESRFDNAGDDALNAEGVQVTGAVFLNDGFHATGRVSLSGASIGGQLTCTKGRFDHPTGDALNAQGVQVTGDVFLNRGFHATGEVSLSGASIGGWLDCTESRFENAGGDALNAQGVQVTGAVFLNKGFHATGEVSLSGASIGGQLTCTKGRFDHPTGDALNAQGVQVTGAVFLNDGFHATGEVSLSGASVGGSLVCTGGLFGHPKGIALTAQRMRVTEGFLWRDVTIDSGCVDMTSAHVGDLVDDLASWPSGDGQLVLDGFTYDRISAAFTDARRRLDWLGRGTVWEGEFLPQPYSQLAKVLREMGHDSAARAVLIEQRTLLGKEARKLRRQWPDGKVIPYHTIPTIAATNSASWAVDFSSRWLVGFGYRPWNALVALAAVFAVAWALASATWTEGSFAPNSDVILTSPAWMELMETDCIGPLPDDYFNDCVKNPADKWSATDAPGMDWDSFHSAAYAVDLVVPILNLGQTEAWAPSKDRGPFGWWLWWGRWVLIAAGWFVTTLGVAALTGIIRRE
jgi:hypothetical protein